VIEVLTGGGQLILSLDTRNVSTTFAHGNVPPGEYTVRVRGVNARGAGEASNSVVVTVQ
jgi:predicted phage tail protein